MCIVTRETCNLVRYEAKIIMCRLSTVLNNCSDSAGSGLKIYRCPWLAVILFLGVAANGLAGTSGPTVSAVVRSAASISLDGKLDEPLWSDAPVVNLVQQSPKPGDPTPYETEVRAVVAKDRIYFGFICKDPDPSRIAVHTMRRDGDMTGDDSITIVLDTYGDRRTGYFFKVNTAGARADGLISDPQSVSLDWDGIWDARVARTPDG